ncbi:transporter substrate-binding domain-containing protein [Agrococcus sp. ARC_14]|uniref:transporter substrate-binding domain-containing protein n=1 Tax=Agrococcus sp. ARC_14 TaxID=2919927 RepID=UPI001F059E4A|nr:transporter substrate-binding domain-containing protein [Agrococcus sp. ARC_14]MCH1883984.1 transporter substrate-binding domain-containing protein [Agrococcus sp. ARC_14]
MHLTTRTRVFPGIALTVIAGLALTSCAAADAEPEAGEQPTSDAGSIAVVQAAADLLPDAISEAGVLRVAIPTNEPPTQFYREGTEEMTGLNPDMAALVAGALGLELEVVVSNFDSIIPGLAADRFDMTVSSMTPTEERMEQLDFVDYVDMGSALVVAAGNPAEVDVDALCGARVGVLTGSYQLTVKIPALNEACAEAGGEPLEIQQFQDTRQAISSLGSGRSDAVYADGPILSYAALQNPDIEVAGELDVSPVGIGVPKASGLIDAVGAAMAAIIESPEYLEVLGSYGLEAMALEEARINFPQ